MRGLAARPPLRPVTEGRRAEFQVDSRGAPYRWRVRRLGDSAVRKRGRETKNVLAFRAPTGPSGVYLLELRSGRWHTTVPFLVQAEQRSSVLVVVPTITWLGTDKVDDRPFDGLPNTLADGGTVRWPRVFVGEDGLPAGFADDIAPLLVFLDRRRIRYDLTSDIDLDLTRNPRASDREGVLFAGSERWVTRTLSRRLRKYVTDGGRVALFGADSMRRGVRLRVLDSEDAGTLLRATQPTATDPFGARFGKPRDAVGADDAQPVRGRPGVRADGGRARPAGLQAARGVRARRGPEPARRGRPAAQPRGGGRRARRPARRHVSCARR